MKFRDLEEAFRDSQLITTQDIRNVFQEINRGQLSVWEKDGRLVRIRQGQYVLGSKADTVDRELLANEIQNSYLSLEYALSLHGLIPDIPQIYTSVTTERVGEYQTPLGTFSYRRIKPNLFTDYALKPSSVQGREVKVASPTKALFDWAYLNPIETPADFAELRLNPEILEGIFDKEQFERWESMVRSPTKLKSLANLRQQC